MHESVYYQKLHYNTNKNLNEITSSFQTFFLFIFSQKDFVKVAFNKVVIAALSVIVFLETIFYLHKVI